MTLSPEGGGVLLVDKPSGPTSHDVVDQVRRALGTRRVGHTGTLDPFASGLLLLCVGPATRLSEYLTGLPKEYEATARLGVATTTHDPEGEVVCRRSGWEGLDAATLDDVLQRFRGSILQRPPAYSAKKLSGVPAHRRARRGEVVDLQDVPVHIDLLEVLDLPLPEVVLRLRCSSGTYVRALARDLGEALGVGAHLTSLRRTAVGSFQVSVAVRPTDLEAAGAAAHLVDPADALEHLGRIPVDGDQALRIARGQRIELDDDLQDETGPVAVIHEGRLLAVGELEGRILRPRKVFA